MFPWLSSRDVYPRKNERRARERERCQFLAEEGRGFDERKKRDEVDEVVRARRSDGPNHLAPGGVGGAGSEKREEYHVERDFPVEQGREVEPDGGDKEQRNDRDERVKEYFSRDVVRRVFAVDVADYDRIDGPAQRRKYREKVTDGVELEHELAVQDDERRARERDDGADDRVARDLFVFQEKVRDDRSEDGRRRHEQRYVRGERKFERIVFRDEIKRAARHSREELLQFRLEAFGAVHVRMQNEHQKVRERKPVHENLDGREHRKEHLGRDERGAPDDDGQDGKEVGGGFRGFHSSFSMMSASVRSSSGFSGAKKRSSFPV